MPTDHHDSVTPSTNPRADSRRNVIVTTSWDDGHVHDRRLAELLVAYRLRATFYIAPHNREIAPRARLAKGAIADLSTRFEIGGHTLTHVRLPQTSPAQARHEIAAGKADLEDITGRPIRSFCYPGGAYEPAHLGMVRDAGFSLARTVVRHRSRLSRSLLELPTTFHAFRHLADGPSALRLAKGRVMAATRYYLNWDEFAIACFDRCVATGGVFHLWGHSWEISATGDWARLERVFDHISGRSDVTYIDNHEITLLPEDGDHVVPS